jgi:adenine/guanine phosphoribosyltransferase-like PRPP-binding protein
MQTEAKTQIVYRIKETKPNPKNKLHQLLSGVKLGDKNSINLCADSLIMRIKREINFSKPKEWIIINPSAVITNITAMFYVTQLIAKKLKILHVKIGYKKSYRHSEFYTNLTLKERRKQIYSRIYYKGKSIKNKKVILVDDVIATGVSINATKKLLLKHGAKFIHPFIFMKVKKYPYNMEKKMVLTNLIGDKNYVIKRLNKGSGVITTKVISSFLFSPDKEKRRILSLLNPQIKRKFKKYLVEYANKSFLKIKNV